MSPPHRELTCAKARSAASRRSAPRDACSPAPPARLHTSFGEIFEAFRHAVQSFAPAEQAALFHGNAGRCYRIGGRAEAPKVVARPQSRPGSNSKIEG